MTFEHIFQHTLLWEGEGCHQAAGEDWWTCWGIAEKYNPEIFGKNALGPNGLPTKEQAFAQARRQYWDAVGADSLPLPLRIVVFDHGFNTGPERTLGLLEPGDSFASFTAKRIRFYSDPVRRNRNLNLPGWMNRTAHFLSLAESASAGLEVVVMHNLTTPILGNLGDRLVAAWRGYQKTAQIVVRQPAQYQVRPSTNDPTKLKLDISFTKRS